MFAEDFGEYSSRVTKTNVFFNYLLFYIRVHANRLSKISCTVFLIKMKIVFNTLIFFFVRTGLILRTERKREIEWEGDEGDAEQRWKSEE